MLKIDAEQLYTDQIDTLGGLLARLKCQRPMLVLDRGAVAASGLEPVLTAQLADTTVVQFDAFTPNPKVEEVAEAARSARAHQADCIVAVGGGSCLDVAKVAAAVVALPDSIDRITGLTESSTVVALPVIAVPTTSGTGSEATHFAAVYVDGNKKSIAHAALRPVAVILDARFHRAMPPYLAACTGLDALAQAMESLWAVGGDESSCRFAREGGQLAAANLISSVRESDGDARAALMKGAHLAGQAINRSKTTAAHALSYQITTLFGVPHGLAVALTLGHIGAENALVTPEDCNDPRGMAYVRGQVEAAAALLQSSTAGLPEAVGALLRALSVPATLEEAGVPKSALGELAHSVDTVRLGNNPRALNTAQLEALLHRAWGTGIV